MKAIRELLQILPLCLALNAQGAVPALLISEEFPGGSGSTSDFSANAFSHPMSGTRGEVRREFVVGNSFFKTSWVSSPASTLNRDGLGPLYNAVSCSSCHLLDGRGRGLPDNPGVVDISLLFRLRVKKEFFEVAPHPIYGGQFQPFAVEGVQGEGRVSVSFKKMKGQFADGNPYELSKPIYSFDQLSYGPLGKNTIASPRVAPQMIGLGLVEAIDQKDIVSLADPDDLNEDGISGRPNWVESLVTGKKTLGRFGHKAGKATLKEQNAAAFQGDIGITSSLHPEEECTLVQVDCQNHKTSNDISDEILDKVTLYTQLLAVPKRREFKSPQVLRGRDIFFQASCQSCHHPSFETRSDMDLSILSGQTIYPYSDFLLHDMGDELADDQEAYLNEESASAREWRTPPLWGLGLVETVNGHTRYLHDGRARSLEEAILWHGGEAQGSKQKYLKLGKNERSDLLKFLKSL